MAMGWHWGHMMRVYLREIAEKWHLPLEAVRGPSSYGLWNIKCSLEKRNLGKIDPLVDRWRPTWGVDTHGEDGETPGLCEDAACYGQWRLVAGVVWRGHRSPRQQVELSRHSGHRHQRHTLGTWQWHHNMTMTSKQHDNDIRTTWRRRFQKCMLCCIFRLSEVLPWVDLVHKVKVSKIPPQ